MNECTKVKDAINHYLKKNDAAVKKYGVKKITYMPILMKCMSVTLKEFPVLNACLVNQEEAGKVQLMYRASHNIGIAMDTTQGYVSLF